MGTQALQRSGLVPRDGPELSRPAVLGLDARDGRVATEGWLDVSTVEATTLAEQFDDLPLAGVVYTDIARDGMLEGPNLAATEALAVRLKTPVIASGGVGTSGGSGAPGGACRSRPASSGGPCTTVVSGSARPGNGPATAPRHR